MLFSAPEYIFLFLPVTLIVYLVLIKGKFFRSALVWLSLASVFFYGWWKAEYVVLLAVSIVFNFCWSRLQMRHIEAKGIASTKLLTIGVIANLSLLGYFKYANFFVDNVNAVIETGWRLEHIALPLAISFFTFQQIAYLVDVHRKIVGRDSFRSYVLFVTFFPQLIAGPIVHHKDMMPQFSKPEALSVNIHNIAIGMLIFLMGLFKKTVLADSMAGYANPVFNAADAGQALSALEAWGGSLAYTFQLYFDFSGYSDMAVGAARLFGIHLAINFNSPYKSLNISDFWRRWHMTLSAFLRDYLYIALGGNRKGEARRHVNLATTMLLGGLWHGAGWNFVIWGGLHGIYLVINHSWRSFLERVGYSAAQNNRFYRYFAFTLTFIAVVYAWVLFRAETLSGAMLIIRAMSGGAEWLLPYFRDAQGINEFLGQFGTLHPLTYLDSVREVAGLVLLFIVAVALPNTQQIAEWTENSLRAKGFKLYALTGFVAYSIFLVAIINLCKEVNEFIYFNF